MHTSVKKNVGEPETRRSGLRGDSEQDTAQVMTRKRRNIQQAELELELEFFLRPTVSRPVRLGIGPPFGTLDQILSCSCFV
jgi:hypothetical protein